MPDAACAGVGARLSFRVEGNRCLWEGHIDAGGHRGACARDEALRAFAGEFVIPARGRTVNHDRSAAPAVSAGTVVLVEGVFSQAAGRVGVRHDVGVAVALTELIWIGRSGGA